MRDHDYCLTSKNGDTFAETFGKGSFAAQSKSQLARRPTPDFLEDYTSKPLTELRIQRSSTTANLKNVRQRDASKTSFSYQQGKERETNRQKNQSALSKYAYIDDINDKIQGLIRSISVSCKKKPKQKTENLVHEKTDKNFDQVATFRKQLPLNYDDHKTEKKKYSLPQKKPKGPNFFDNEKKIEISYANLQKISFDFKKNHQSNGFQQGQFDDLNERIKKISNKIYLYQLKTGLVKPKPEAIDLRKQLKQRVIAQNFKKKAQIIERKTGLLNEISNIQARMTTNKKPLAKQNKQNQKMQQKFNPFNKKINYNEKYEQASRLLKQQKEDQKQKELDFYLPCLKNNQLLSYKSTFVKSFVEQISLDHDFRHTKHLFAGIYDLSEQDNEDCNSKWMHLQSELKGEGFRFDLKEVKQIFKPKEDEIDPFMSVSHCHQQLIHGIIFAYQASQRHWNEKIYHNWTHWQLRESKFTMDTIDRDRKGYITLQDLAIYINTEIDGSYRNRDLLLIFNRLLPDRSSKRFHNEGEGWYRLKFKEILDKLLSV